jgi:hypothetical protein
LILKRVYSLGEGGFGGEDRGDGLRLVDGGDVLGFGVVLEVCADLGGDPGLWVSESLTVGEDGDDLPLGVREA